MNRKLKRIWFLATSPRSFYDMVISHLMSQMRLRETLFRYVDWRDQNALEQHTQTPVPPASLRFRVHGDLSVSSFLGSGSQCSQDIKDALAKVGKDITQFQHILDFGCGCGRTLIWFGQIARSSSFFGTDIDHEAIAWCRRHLDFANFETNDLSPPLRFPANTFDLVYAISVFTHLNEEYQFCWLRELERVTKSKGCVLITVHGSYYWSKMSPLEKEEILRKGFRFTAGPKSMRNIFPDWYQTAFHTKEYVRSNYSKYFDVLDYIPSGLDNCQDVVVLQKP